MKYWTCPHCGTNLDHGEKCDCNKDSKFKEDFNNENEVKKNSHPEL